MLEIRDLTTTFRFHDQAVRALDHVDLRIEAGEFFVLLGPSGCGKTTLLRAIAGLGRPDGGEIKIDGTTVFAGNGRSYIPPEHRPIAMVFQSYAIWPHMDVYENIAFPLREGVRRLAKSQIAARVDEVLALLSLEELADRPVTMLSGGQQQRVALARALALRPKVLLMDEPLSNLDHKLQLRLRVQIRELLHRLQLTTVYVTHNQIEALTVADRIALMDEGRLVQIGAPRALYRFPANEFVAGFIGEMNLVPAIVKSVDNDGPLLETACGLFRAASLPECTFRPGDRCSLGIRPEDIEIQTASDRRENVIGGEIIFSQFAGESVQLHVKCGSHAFEVRAHHAVDLAAGQSVSLRFPPEYTIPVRLAPFKETARNQDTGLANVA